MVSRPFVIFWLSFFSLMLSSSNLRFCGVGCSPSCHLLRFLSSHPPFISLGLSRFLFHSAFGLSVGAYLHNTLHHMQHIPPSPRSGLRITHPAMHNDHFSSIQVNYTPLAISASPPSPHRIARRRPPFACSLIRPVTHSFIPHPTHPTQLPGAHGVRFCTCLRPHKLQCA